MLSDKQQRAVEACIGAARLVLVHLRIADDEYESTALWTLCRVVALPYFPIDKPIAEQQAFVYYLVKRQMKRMLYDSRRKRSRLFCDLPDGIEVSTDVTPQDELQTARDAEAAQKELDQYEGSHKPGNFSSKTYNIMKAKRKAIYGDERRVDR
jgi:hypothetical protein